MLDTEGVAMIHIDWAENMVIKVTITIFKWSSFVFEYCYLIIVMIVGSGPNSGRLLEQ